MTNEPSRVLIIRFARRSPPHRLRAEKPTSRFDRERRPTDAEWRPAGDREWSQTSHLHHTGRAPASRVLPISFDLADASPL